MLKDLFTKDELNLYQSLLYPFSLFLIRDKLDLKLEHNPAYEVFVPLIYYKSSFGGRKGDGPRYIAPYKLFISNLGRVVSFRGAQPVFLNTYVGSGGYPRVSITIPKVLKVKVLLHRALGCSFIPVLQELGPFIHPKDLEVNHINGIKVNFGLNNLEWTTRKQNIEHAALNELMSSGLNHYSVKPIKGVILKGDYKDYKFILIGAKHIRKNGFNHHAVSKVCTGRHETHKNCIFSFATEEEIHTLPKGVTNEIKFSLGSTHTRVLSTIIATNILTGLEILIKGGKSELIKLGFDESSVTKAIKGTLKSHKGHTFKRTN